MAAATAAPSLRDWADLHLDLLVRIIACLEFPDALAAAAVCTTWRAAGIAALGPAVSAPGRFLWLFCVDESEDSALLFDVSSGRSHRIALPGPHLYDLSFWISGAWLLTVSDGNQLSLINPFARSYIPLPPGLHRQIAYFGWDQSALLDTKAVFSGDPSKGGGFTFLLMHGRSFGYKVSFLFTSSGRVEWQRLATEYPVAIVDGCISHDGKFLTINVEGTIEEWDAGSAPWNNKPLKPRMIFKNRARLGTSSGYSLISTYLVPSPWGDLLHIQWLVDTSKALEFRVFEVNLRKQTLEKTTSLRGHALIWSRNNCSIVSVDSHPVLLPDCIHIIRNIITTPDDAGGYLWSDQFYNLATGTVQPFSSSPALPSSFLQKTVWTMAPSFTSAADPHWPKVPSPKMKKKNVWSCINFMKF